MRKKILIPTDFTVQSLNILKSILSANNSGQIYDIVLLHGLSLTDSIRDLLFYSKHKQIEKLITPEFKEAYEIIRNKFDSQVGSLKIDLFTGYNLSAFSNYLEANKIDQIFISHKRQEFTNRNSFDLSPFINKCKIQVTTIESAGEILIPEKGKVTEVFIDQVSMG